MMQINYSELTNDTINLNSKLFNKSVELSVETVQQLMQGTTEQTGEWLKIKSFDDYVKSQDNWNRFAVAQAQNVTQSMISLGREAYSSYSDLWQNVNQTVGQQAAKAAAKPVAEVAAKPAARKNG